MPTTDKAAMKQRVFATAEAAHVRFVRLQFTDIMGVVKNVHIPSHKFGDAVDHGLWFDGSSIEGFARIHESDMFLDPDLDTFGIIPWERSDAGSTAKVICDVYTPDGESFAGDPRGVLRRQLKRADDMGLRYMTGPELEFFMLPHSAVQGFNGTSTNGNGNGMHTHQSLWSPDGKTNLFYDASDEYHLSPIARSFMAGLLAHAPGMIAIL